MMEVSTVLFTLLTEGFVALLVMLSITVFILYKRKNRDKVAVKKLVDQIKQQSKTRMGKTGSFLNEKYRFEGNELEKAVKAIDKAEKKFMQKLINVYLKRDTDGLIAMDACIAELIETYKALSPVMPDAEALAEMSSGSPEQAEELEQLRGVNELLTKELAITKETMGNMVAEFGNMFGGGNEHELDNVDVLDKVGGAIDKQITDDPASVSEQHDENLKQEQEQEPIQQQESMQSDIQPDDSVADELPPDAPVSEELPMEDSAELDDLMKNISINENKDDGSGEKEKNKQQSKATENFDEGLDDLMDGIDLSDDDQ